MPSQRTPPVIAVERFGREAEPVVIIDNFSGRIEQLIAAGRAAHYKPEPMYPGMRSAAPGAYLQPMYPLLEDILRQAFGLGGASIANCDFSVVSVPPDELIPLQRIPHYDDAEANVLALLHYTQGPEWGGTAFFRHQRTGFETVTPERRKAYSAAMAEDEGEFGPEESRYFAGSGHRYECIGEVEARPDRALLYRGRTLHSGVIPKTPDPATAVASGRLTINTFLIGTP